MSPKPVHKPNFFIVGVARCGTTSMRHYMQQHPDIFFSPIKEPCHFCTDMDPRKFRGPFKKIASQDYTRYLKSKNMPEMHIAWITKQADYLKLFRDVSDEKAVGEASVLYLFSKTAAQEIHRFNPDARIIIMLRDPVERALSHYRIDVSSGLTNNSINDLIDKYDEKNMEWGTRSLCLEMSAYTPQIQRYLDVFPRNRIKIIFYEHFINNPNKMVRDIFSFLNVDPGIQVHTTERYNPSSLPVPRYTIVHSIAAKLKLKQVYDVIPFDKIKKVIEKMYYRNPVTLPPDNRVIHEKLAALYKNDLKKLKKVLQPYMITWLE